LYTFIDDNYWGNFVASSNFGADLIWHSFLAVVSPDPDREDLSLSSLITRSFVESSLLVFIATPAADRGRYGVHKSTTLI